MRIRNPAGSSRKAGRATVWSRSLSVLALIAVAVSACSTDNPLSLRPDIDVGMETAAVPVMDMPVADLPVENAPVDGPSDIYLAAYPRPEAPDGFGQSDGGLEQPMEEPGFSAVPDDPGIGAMPEEYEEPRRTVMPQDEISCRQALDRLSVSYENLSSINDGGACKVDYPVKMAAVGSVTIQPAATVTCQMALAFATWTRKELVPAARTRYFSGVKTIHQASSYSCRNIRGTRTASEHSKGNAMDIGRIVLNSGRKIEVEKQGLFAFRSKGFLNSVRSDGCNYFNTVLGPGYDRDHRDHFHFDIKSRRNGHKACH